MAPERARRGGRRNCGRRNHRRPAGTAAQAQGRRDGGRALSALLVFVGGGSGALLRWWLGGLVRAPWGTLTVNVAGCLVMGLLAGWLARTSDGEQARLLLGAGLLGGFTTMSAFALESVELWSRSPAMAALYAGATIAGSLAALAAGLSIAR